MVRVVVAVAATSEPVELLEPEEEEAQPRGSVLSESLRALATSALALPGVVGSAAADAQRLRGPVSEWPGEAARQRLEPVVDRAGRYIRTYVVS